MQRNCLRLVARPMSSKEIARELNIASQTVDKHVKAAMATLGVNTRQQAARMLLAHEQQSGATQFLGTPPPDLAARSQTPLSVVPSIDDRGYGTPAGRVELREARAAFEAIQPAIRTPIKWPLPIGGRRDNDLTRVERMIWIFLIMVLTIISFAMLASTAETIGRIARSIAGNA